MPQNDDGEFELVLGNRQLLSGLFIIVMLFGVFFTLGYIVGRHSFPAPLNTAAAGSQDGAAPRPVTPSDTPATPAPSLPPGQAEVISGETKPAETPATPEPVTGTRPATAPAETPRPIERKQTEVRPVSSDLSEPVPGTYLQVAAPKRTAAAGIVDSLRNREITAVLAPGPNEETVRVLVGPLEPSSVGRMKMDLESAGFKPFVKKY
jgi:hypothetical protein